MAKTKGDDSQKKNLIIAKKQQLKMIRKMIKDIKRYGYIQKETEIENNKRLDLIREQH